MVTFVHVLNQPINRLKRNVFILQITNVVTLLKECYIRRLSNTRNI